MDRLNHLDLSTAVTVCFPDCCVHMHASTTACYGPYYEAVCAAQARLCKAGVLVIGAGGLGCPAALYLAAAGVGRLGIVDQDAVELSNLHRQIAHSEGTVGMHKADSAAQSCRGLNSSIQVCTVLNIPHRWFQASINANRGMFKPSQHAPCKQLICTIASNCRKNWVTSKALHPHRRSAASPGEALQLASWWLARDRARFFSVRQAGHCIPSFRCLHV